MAPTTTRPDARLRLAAALTLALAVAILPAPGASEPSAAAAVPLETLLPADLALHVVDPADPAAATLTNDGIGPGSQIVVRFATVGKLCTANWVWKDDAGTPYLGAAGHCFLPDSSSAEVYACRSKCVFGGQAGGIQQGLAGAGTSQAAFTGPQVPRLSVLGDWVRLGAVVYAQANGPANDFGLVAIPAAVVPSLDPAMPFWGAPTAVATTVEKGDLAVIHGNAATLAETLATKSRIGTFNYFGAETWGADLAVAGGDSGSAVGRIANLGADTDLSQAEAAGIVTHLGACDYVLGQAHFGGDAGCATGPTVGRAKALAATAGLCIEVVLVSEDPTGLSPASC
jgi:hypothetical protein